MAGSSEPSRDGRSRAPSRHAATTRGARTRSAVLAAARARFAAEGYDGATGARIAADAGVSEPTIAFHFGSKAGLLIAVMREYYDDLLERMDEVVHGASDPESRLRRFARWWLRHNAEHVDLVAVFGRQGRRAEPDEVVTAFRDANRRVTRAFERLVDDLKHAGVLRTDVPTRIARDAFFGGAEHILVRRTVAGRATDIEADADDLVGLLLRGAAVADPGAAEPTGQGGVADGARRRGGALPEAPVRADTARIEAKLDRVLALLGRGSASE